MQIQVGMIPGGRSTHKYVVCDSLALDVTIPHNELLEVLSEANASPNMDSDILDIVANLEAGKLWAGFDVHGEGVVVLAPMTVSISDMKIAAYEEYNGDGE